MSVVGYVGLGMMGSAMCRRLTQAYRGDVFVHDLDRAAVDDAVGHGAVAAGSTAEVAARAETVSVCVPAAEHVEAVLAEIAATGRAGQALLVHSTVHPDTIRSARRLAARWGGLVFDACVAGGAEAAEAGELVVLAGGLADMPAPAAGLLGVYGSKVIDAGPVGSGTALKIAVNVMTYAQFAAAAIAHEGVAATGGRPEALLEAWRHTGMLGGLTERWWGLLGVGPGQATGDFRAMLEAQAGIASKDLGLAAALGEPGPSSVAALDAIRALMPAIYRTVPMKEA